MQPIDQHNAAEYLKATGRAASHESLEVRELTGGVSNMVLLVRRPGDPAEEFVIKQARAQLRTQQPWYSRVERIWREADVLRICERLLGHATAAISDFQVGAPRILFEDREQFLFAMTAAREPHVVWKADLLAGQIDERVATAAGALLSRLHAGSWHDPECAGRLGDRSLFEELRVDPYYRTLLVNRPESRAALEPLIASLADNPCCLVHADFSPKNMLVSPGQLLLVDFETGHFGDPAFDLGFFLSHLVLKACLKAPEHAPYLALSQAFAQAYQAGISRAVSESELAKIWSRGVLHFAACGWARLDGKSPVEYLSNEGRRASMRALCRRVLDEAPNHWSKVVALADEQFRN